MKKTLLAVLSAATCIVVSPASAADCPDGSAQPDELVTASPAALAALAAHLALRAPHCTGHAGFLAWHGAVLNRLGQHRAAADQIERALLLEPRLMGARLDYAEALGQLGEHAAARALLRDTLARPDLPAGLAPLRAREERQAAAAGWITAGTLSLAAVHDNNLNRATRATSLALTLPGETIELPIAPGSRARSGNSLLWQLRASAGRDIGAGNSLHLHAEATRRDTPGLAETRLTSADIAALWRRAQPEGGHASWILATGKLGYGGHEISRYARLSHVREGMPAGAGGCRPGWGGDAEIRRHPAAAELDHHFLQLRALAGCELPWGTRALPLRLQLGLGRELARSERPGGDTWRLAAQLAGQLPAGPGVLDIELRYSLRRDDAGYSPLLAAGRRLVVQAWSARAEYRHPLANGIEGLLAVDMDTQRASLNLFQVSGTAVHAGLRWFW